MIGIIVLSIMFAYVFIAWQVIRHAGEKAETEQRRKKAKRIALVIFILIPIWDIVLFGPIYAYLCIFHSGPKIYQTVENVKGVYIGERNNKYDPVELYDSTYSAFGYVDYAEVGSFWKDGKHYSNELTGMYYRSFWLNDNSSSLCIQPKYPDSPYNKYSKAFRNGRCIAKEEIQKEELSHYGFVKGSNGYLIFPFLRWRNLYVIEDRITNQRLGKYRGYQLGVGWWTVGFYLVGMGLVGGGDKCGDYSKMDEFAKMVFINK